MHACSCSKVIAAYAEKEFQDEILNGPMRAYTEHTKVTEEVLRQEFSDILTRGYGECVEEIEVGISSVAAPVQIPHIGAIFSIGATGSIRRFNAKYRQKIGNELIKLSGKIATSIQLLNASNLNR